MLLQPEEHVLPRVRVCNRDGWVLRLPFAVPCLMQHQQQCRASAGAELAAALRGSHELLLRAPTTGSPACWCPLMAPQRMGPGWQLGNSCIPWLAAGVMCLDFHPQHANLLAVGCYDGSVSVFDVRSTSNKPMYRQGLHLSCTLLKLRPAVHPSNQPAMSLQQDSAFTIKYCLKQPP